MSENNFLPAGEYDQEIAYAEGLQMSSEMSFKRLKYFQIELTPLNDPDPILYSNNCYVVEFYWREIFIPKVYVVLYEANNNAPRPNGIMKQKVWSLQGGVLTIRLKFGGTYWSNAHNNVYLQISAYNDQKIFMWKSPQFQLKPGYQKRSVPAH